ncbi:MAG: peptide chain release factor N(5)-glutamine methyltransferase [Candidatus Uhrbacteria bacterium]|nr:peptide chain release factor N(5)-glutamine methyltransferase [Candidatus Uhrbacteria bacterium]
MHDTTILEALTWAGDRLKASGVSKLDAQVILAACLAKPTAHLFAHGEEIIQPDLYDQFQRFVERRARHEPVAYLLGRKEFYGRTFFVNASVLVPRPETEILVDIAKSFVTPTSIIIDVGTGSGAIALTLAADTAHSVFACDTDQQAIAVARQNAEALGLKDRVIFGTGHLFEPFVERNIPIPQHLVVTANLPYLTPWQVDTLDADVKDYEPRHALVGGADGLALYDELFGQLKTYTHEASRRGTPVRIDVVIEIDPSQARTAPALVASHFPQARIDVVNDLASRARFVVARI